MGFFDDLFKSPFDFNGDGKVSIDEQWLAFNIMNECMKEENPFSDDSLTDSDYSIPDIDWRDYCEDGSEYSIFPENYETEEEYIEALELAKAEIIELEQEDYPNQRMREAAIRISHIKRGIALFSDGDTAESEIEKCEFILSSSVIAARYLTVFDGFILGQAIKENFKLPVNVPDEDTQSQVYFPTLFMDIAEEDVNLALDIWVWCVKEFGPYKKYFEFDDKFYDSIVCSMDDYPETFIDVAVKRLSSDTEFRKGLLTESPEVLYSSYKFITRALQLNLIKEAQDIFTAISMNPLINGKPMEELINSIINSCSDWQSLEMMELVKYHIMPLVEKLDDKRIQRLFPKFMEEIDEYINHIEKSSKKYQFSRRYEWRNHCADGTQYNIDPLDYDTEQDYNAAIHNAKYAWRNYKRNNRFGIDVELFETEAEYEIVERQKSEERLKAIEKRCKITPKTIEDLSEEDKNVYKFCAVVFEGTNKYYHYLIDGLDVKVGDKVVIPIGDLQQERIATVVSVLECMKHVAPYPVEKAKTIIKILDESCDT